MTIPHFYRQDLSGLSRERLDQSGFTASDFEAQAHASAKAAEWLARQKTQASLPLLSYPDRRDDLDALAPHVAWLRGFERLVLFGTGGSSLGAMALASLRPSDGPQILFQDNLEPVGLAQILAADLRKTGFLVISKSGGTAETLAQLLAALDALAQQKLAPADHILAVAEPGDNLVRRIAKLHGLRVLDHDPGVGGRYSVLTLVGLLPAMVMGLDAYAVRRGAKAVLDHALRDPAAAPLLGAAAMVALNRDKGANALVLMPYESRLDQFARWYAQLWAESLGKNGLGSLPVRALGPVDQHSQAQLYLGGPKDKAYTILLPAHEGQGPLLRASYAGGDSALDYLDGRTFGDLLVAEGRATAEALIRNDRPVRLIHLPRLDEETLGALFMHFMIETMAAAVIMGVDAFDQPAVEEGKRLTRQYLADMPGRA